MHECECKPCPRGCHEPKCGLCEFMLEAGTPGYQVVKHHMENENHSHTTEHSPELTKLMEEVRAHTNDHNEEVRWLRNCTLEPKDVYDLLSRAHQLGISEGIRRSREAVVFCTRSCEDSGDDCSTQTLTALDSLEKENV